MSTVPPYQKTAPLASDKMGAYLRVIISMTYRHFEGKKWRKYRIRHPSSSMWCPRSECHKPALREKKRNHKMTWRYARDIKICTNRVSSLRVRRFHRRMTQCWAADLVLFLYTYVYCRPRVSGEARANYEFTSRISCTRVVSIVIWKPVTPE